VESLGRQRNADVARGLGFVSTDEVVAAVSLPFSRSTLFRLAKEGRLGPKTVDGRFYWSLAEVRAVVDGWERRPFGTVSTLRRLRLEGKVTSRAAAHIVGVSPFILHGVDRETLPYTEDGPGGCRVYLETDLLEARSRIREEHCPHDDTELTMAVSEAQAELGLTDVNSVYNAVKRGRLDADKTGFPMRITRESVERYKGDRRPTRGSARMEAAAQRVLSRRQVAPRLGLSASTVRELIVAGVIPTTQKKRPGWETYVDEEVVDRMLAARRPCPCGDSSCDGRTIFPWAAMAPGHWRKARVGRLYPHAHKAIHRRIDDTLADADLAAARRWRQLAAGLFVRWDRYKDGVHTERDMILDTVVAFGSARTTPQSLTAEEVGGTVGALKVRLRRLHTEGDEYLDTFGIYPDD
jgi:predicted DNA-binding transcriptional regulator AlpA